MFEVPLTLHDTQTLQGGATGELLADVQCAFHQLPAAGSDMESTTSFTYNDVTKNYW